MALFILAAALAFFAFIFLFSGTGDKAHYPGVPAHRHPTKTAARHATDYGETKHPAASPKEKSAEEVEPTPSLPHSVNTPAEFSRGDASSSRIALTFDAGASAEPCSKILDVLAKHHVHSTFFLTGKWIVANPELVRRIAGEGHEIGNHTYHHRRLTKLSHGDIADEVEKTERLVEQATGKSTKPLLRVPYGDRDRRVFSVLADLGYTSIYWDLDSWDSVKEGITPAEIESRVTGKVRNGSIVLMHCGSSATADALDDMLDRLTAAGYQPVKVSELMQQ